jgi:hypothetical protein
VAKALAQPLAQRLAPVKLEEVHQKCIDANPVLPKEYLFIKWGLQIRSTSYFL